MTVRELIERLGEYDPGLVVYVREYGEDGWLVEVESLRVAGGELVIT
jgi:hypothetical protein